MQVDLNIYDRYPAAAAVYADITERQGLQLTFRLNEDSRRTACRIATIVDQCVHESQQDKEDIIIGVLYRISGTYRQYGFRAATMGQGAAFTARFGAHQAGDGPALDERAAVIAAVRCTATMHVLADEAETTPVSPVDYPTQIENMITHTVNVTDLVVARTRGYYLPPPLKDSFRAAQRRTFHAVKTRFIPSAPQAWPESKI